jgi:ribonuclease D
MAKILYNKFDKKQIPALPTIEFEGRIIVVLTPVEAEKAVDFLLTQPILGVDTETRPSFKRGWQYKVSLLQVATADICFLFRLNHIGLSPAIIRLLEDKTTPKIGLSWHDDLNGLKKLGQFTPGYFIDLQEHVKEIGIEDLSLQKLYANMLGKRINKRQQLSNWERDILDDKQKIYAATDAWACIQLYNELQRLETTHDYQLIINQEENNATNLSETRQEG